MIKSFNEETPFAGLAVGGPMDGQRIVSQSMIHRVTVREPASAGDFDYLLRSLVRVRVEVVTYDHHIIAGVGFWTLHNGDIDDVTSLLAALVDGYRVPHGALR